LTKKINGSEQVVGLKMILLRSLISLKHIEGYHQTSDKHSHNHTRPANTNLINPTFLITETYYVLVRLLSKIKYSLSGVRNTHCLLAAFKSNIGVGTGLRRPFLTELILKCEMVHD